MSTLMLGRRLIQRIEVFDDPWLQVAGLLCIKGFGHKEAAIEESEQQLFL